MQGICGRGYGRARLDIQTRGDYSKGLTDHVRLSVRCRQNKTGTHDLHPAAALPSPTSRRWRFATSGCSRPCRRELAFEESRAGDLIGVRTEC